MAERIQVELVDDIDGSPAQQTVTFALDGVTYEIDLSELHARALRSVLARYIDCGSPRQPRRSRQQELEERRTKKANETFTEQIRNAAQRSNDLRRRKLKEQQQTPAVIADTSVPPPLELAVTAAPPAASPDKRVVPSVDFVSAQ